MPTILITGGHSGIGLAAARELAAKGTDLVLAGRSTQRMQPVKDELTKKYGVSVTLLTLDTSSLTSVRAAAAEVAKLRETGQVGSLAALVCNAGGRFDGEVTYSPEGYETTFATNYLGNFLLVDLLLPYLGEAARVVFTASGTHDRDSMDGRMVGAAVEPDATLLAGDGKDGRKTLSAGKRYATSKLCVITYAYELDRRLRGAGSTVVSIAYDPGSVPTTGFLRDMPRAVQWFAATSVFSWLTKRVGGVVSDVEFSGASLAELASSPEYGDRSGEYFQANDGILSSVRSAHLTYDRRRAKKLWEDSERLVARTADAGDTGRVR
ncbi:SDR family NAD(P)-dependent oxidoreductase [Streptomyces sp. NBUA17]|uniref:SDR family NAD(P)-dependent oxidoreductase n=1 Tax=Streptomyces sp. NBUA17 TaxID=3062275 RepID=UPI0037D9E340